MGDHEPPAAVALCRVLHRPRHEPVAVGMQQHARERIDRAHIEATRDDDQFRPEPVQRRQHDPLERMALRVAAAVSRQRHFRFAPRLRVRGMRSRPPRRRVALKRTCESMLRPLS